MKAPTLPEHVVTSAPVPGTFYRAHTIKVAGQIVHSQLGPYSEKEIEDRIRAFVNPEPVRAMPAFDAKAYGYSSKGGRGKKSAARIDAEIDE